MRRKKLQEILNCYLNVSKNCSFFSIFFLSLSSFGHSPFKLTRFVNTNAPFVLYTHTKKQYRGIRLRLTLPGCTRCRQRRRKVHCTTEICITELKETCSHAHAYTRRCRPLRRRLEHPCIGGRVVISSHRRETAFFPWTSSRRAHTNKRNFWFTSLHVARPLHIFLVDFAYRFINSQFQSDLKFSNCLKRCIDISSTPFFLSIYITQWYIINLSHIYQLQF